MKRARAFQSENDDNSLDDGDDLMARAADMVDFEDGDLEEDSEEDESSQEIDTQSLPLSSKNGKQRPEKKSKAREPKIGKAEPSKEEDEKIKSLLQLQIDALVSSVRCPSRSSSRTTSLNTFLDRLKHVLLFARVRSAKPAAEAIKSLSQPLPFIIPDIDLGAVNWRLAFLPPASVGIGGSWPVGTSCKWKGMLGWNIDVLAEMPAELYQENDVKGFRYFYKRAYFLAVLYEELQNSKLPIDVSISYIFGKRKPIIFVRSRSSGGEIDFSTLRCVIRIIPTFDISNFPGWPNRLHPSRNNIPISAVGSSEQSSPIYNSDIVSDSSFLKTLQYIERVKEKSPCYVEAVLLLKVWARQRAYPDIVGFRNIGFILAIILAHTIGGTGQVRRTLSPATDSWHLFKGCLDYIARADFRKKPLLANADTRHHDSLTAEQWIAQDTAVLTDSSGLTNLLAEVPQASLTLLRYDAELSLRHIRRDELIAFKVCFLKPLDKPHLRFDHTARIHLPASLRHQLDPLAGLDATSMLAGSLKKMSAVLCKALNDRVRAISLSLSVDTVDLPAVIDLGLVMEPTQASRIAEYGPSADDMAAVKAFRAFWGDRAETRRFKDGRILESVAWDAEGPSERSNIFVHIIQHVLNRHLAIPSTNIHFFAAVYDRLLLEPAKIRHFLYTVDPKDTGFEPLMAAFDFLVKGLKSLQGLPLAISSVSPVSEALRYSSTFVPGPVNAKTLLRRGNAGTWVPVHDCILTFEGSGRWPEDFAAVQKVKAAFLGKMGDLFQESFLGSRCELYFEVATAADGSNCSLDILVPQGFAFRLRIHHQRERLLLHDRLLSSANKDEERQSQKALFSAYYMNFVSKPSHHAALAALQYRHTSLSLTIRITKRWLASHLLSAHVSPELVEIICAKAYLDSQSPFEIPASGSTGFARTLDLLATWNWREEPLIVPLYTSPNVDPAQLLPTISEHDRQRILNLFSEKRRLDPAINHGAWVVATEQDLAGRAWGHEVPSKLVAARVQNLAQVCIQSVAELAKSGNHMVEHLFSPPLEAYDFVLHLNPSAISWANQAVKGGPSIIDSTSLQSSPQALRLAFDPVQAFVERAALASGDAVMLFYDAHGGLVVCGLFNPTLARHRDFRIALDFASMPIESHACEAEETSIRAPVTLDRIGVLQKLVGLSEGLVVKVTTRNTLP